MTHPETRSGAIEQLIAESLSRRSTLNGEPIGDYVERAARAELRTLLDCRLIVRALSNPSSRYTVMFSPNRWSVIDRKPNNCATASAGRDFVDGVPVFTGKARAALEQP